MSARLSVFLFMCLLSSRPSVHLSVFLNPKGKHRKHESATKANVKWISSRHFLFSFSFILFLFLHWQIISLHNLLATLTCWVLTHYFLCFSLFLYFFLLFFLSFFLSFPHYFFLSFHLSTSFSYFMYETVLKIYL